MRFGGLLVALLMVSHWAVGQAGYSISVQLKGLQDGDTVYIGRNYAKNRYYQDTAVYSLGVALFKDPKALPEGMYFILMPRQANFDFFIGKDQDFKLSTDTSDIIRAMVVTGSTDNQVFFDYQKYFFKQRDRVDILIKEEKESKDEARKQAIKDEISAIDKDMVGFIEKFKQDNPGHLFTSVLNVSKEVIIPENVPLRPDGSKDSTWMYYYYKAHYFDNVNLADNRLIRTTVLTPKVDNYFERLVPGNNDSIIRDIDAFLKKCEPSKDIWEYYVREFTYKYETSQIMGQDAVFVHMARNYYGKGRCWWANEEVLKKIKERADILEPLLLGKIAPNMYLADTTHKYRELYSIKAKYTIVYFWDSNCGHCQKETPKLFELAKGMKAQGVAVYAANIERKDDGWKRFIKEKKLFDPMWYNVRDVHNHTDFKTMWDIYSTPVVYILDGNKKIIAKRLGIEQISEFLTNYEKSLVK